MQQEAIESALGRPSSFLPLVAQIPCAAASFPPSPYCSTPTSSCAAARRQPRSRSASPRRLAGPAVSAQARVRPVDIAAVELRPWPVAATPSSLLDSAYTAKRRGARPQRAAVLVGSWTRPPVHASPSSLGSLRTRSSRVSISLPFSHLRTGEPVAALASGGVVPAARGHGARAAEPVVLASRSHRYPSAKLAELADRRF
jgi:hypothetical protein